MARDVPEGRMSLRDVTRSSAFALPLSEAMDRFHDDDSRLSPEERAKLLEEASSVSTTDEQPTRRRAPEGAEGAAKGSERIRTAFAGRSHHDT